MGSTSAVWSLVAQRPLREATPTIRDTPITVEDRGAPQRAFPRAGTRRFVARCSPPSSPQEDCASQRHQERDVDDRHCERSAIEILSGGKAGLGEARPRLLDALAQCQGRGPLRSAPDDRRLAILLVDRSAQPRSCPECAGQARFDLLQLCARIGDREPT